MTNRDRDQDRSPNEPREGRNQPTDMGQSIADPRPRQSVQGERSPHATTQQDQSGDQASAQGSQQSQRLSPTHADTVRNIGRRELLIGGGLVAAVSMSGCMLLGDDDNGGSTRPEWADWIPEKHLSEISDLVKFDIDVLRDELPPEVYDNFGVTDIPEFFGFADEDMDELYQLEAGIDTQVEVITGRFDIDEIATTIDAEFTGTQKEGFEIVTTPGGIEVGLREDVLVLGSEFRDGIAAHAGELDSVGETDEDWDEVLRAVGSAPIAVYHGQSDGFLEPLNYEILGIGAYPDTSDMVEATGHYLYDSEATAESVLENEQAALEDNFIDPEVESIESVEQDGRRIVMTATTSANRI